MSLFVSIDSRQHTHARILETDISIVVVIGALLLGVYLEQKLKVPKWYSRLIEHSAPIILSVASISFGLSYLIFSYMGFVFAPNLHAVGEMGVFLIGRPKWKITESKLTNRLMRHFHRYGVSILRAGTGINLIILGFSEKILAPSLTQPFLLKYEQYYLCLVRGQ